MLIKSKIFYAILVPLIILGVATYIYVNRILNHTIHLEGRSLSTVVDINFFKGLKPGMGKKEVISILGKTNMAYIEEEEERWEWGTSSGIIIYYFNPDEEDGGIGSPEFLPNNLLIDDLFLVPMTFIAEPDKEYEINVIGQDKNPYLSIRTFGQQVDQINYFYSSDNDDKSSL